MTDVRQLRVLDTGVVEGRVQIRARFNKTSRDSFEGWTVIDFIDLDGNGTVEIVSSSATRSGDELDGLLDAEAYTEQADG